MKVVSELYDVVFMVLKQTLSLQIAQNVLEISRVMSVLGIKQPKRKCFPSKSINLK